MLDSEIVYESYIQPFRLVEELGLPCGYEKSFKLAPRYFSANRYLLGIDRRNLDESGLTRIFERMLMPEPLVDNCRDRLADANLLLLGFEESEKDCIYKIYLEFWDQVSMALQRASEPCRPRTLFLGYKWSAFDNRKSVVSEYVYHPRLALDDMIARLEQLNRTEDADPTFDVARELVQLAARLADSESFIYLEVGEAGTQRSSFDINLYRASLSLQQLRPQLERLLNHYQIERGRLDEVYARAGDRQLGHLSGGTGRDGQPFFSVYYDNEPERLR